MSTTPKANVKRRYPDAICGQHFSGDWRVWPAFDKARPLGAGKTAMHAWKSAAKAIAAPREK